MLISIEGIDGAGKNTLSKNLVQQLARADSRITTELLSFPDYPSKTGKLIKGFLTGEWDVTSHRPLPDDMRCSDVGAWMLQSIFAINRFEQWAKLKRYQGALDGLLVLDRYWHSGLTYGTAAGLPADWLAHIHEALPKADMTFYVDVSVEESEKRRPERRDFYERNGDFLRKCRRIYQALATDGQMIEVDGMLSPERLMREVLVKLAANTNFEYVAQAAAAAICSMVL
ncbi:MAG: hypothetical protein A2Y38_16385 [Spirochaetes bacterium GWB1_59_5]|nr:MAG: hypothetical protein A2Y38_16385 [Spirochaetes bacterium GWB1_59_5]